MKKKILFAILLCDMLLAVLSTAAMAEGFVCKYCKTNNTAFLEYRNANDGTGKHYAWYKCNNSGCGKTMRDDNSGSYHSGGTATCTHGKYCEACGAEYGLFGHTSEEGARPTCQQRLVCPVCHEEFGELGNHEIVEYNEIPATCQKEGRTEYSYCIVPGCSYKKGGQAIPKTDHRLKEAREFTREPTCLKKGWKSYYLCKDCSYSTTDWVNALGHDPVPHAAQAPTCTEIGWDAYETCKRCDYTTYVVQPIDPNNHDLVHHDAQAATCTEIGWDAYDTCKRCDYTTYQELSALNHDLVHHDAKIPTCTEIGWDEYDSCERCEYTTYVEQPIDSGNHDLVHHDAKTPTCTEIGWDAYDTCKRCEYTTYQELSALNHDRVHHGAKAPTCTDIGWDAYDTCTRCEYTTYVGLPINSSNHDLEHHAAKTPTCTEIGWNEFDTCKRCNYTTYQELPALNHDRVHHDAKTPTCTDTGWDEYDTCKRCDYTTYQELPALEHDYQQTVVKPACEKDGYTRYTCSRCKDTYTEDAVERLYHWYGEWSPNGDEAHSAGCRREGCKHTGTTDCQKFKFRVEENESLIFCPVCGEVRNGERLELIAGSLATVITGGIPAGEVVARTRNEYLSVAFEYAGKLIVPTGRVKITLPAELLEGKALMLIAPDGRETETHFEIDGEKAAFTLDFTDAEIPVMLLRTDFKA